MSTAPRDGTQVLAFMNGGWTVIEWHADWDADGAWAWGENAEPVWPCDQLEGWLPLPKD